MIPTSEHERLRRLVLSWEDLDGPERAEAQTHLDECAACRELRATFERHERAPGPHGELPASALSQPPSLSQAERSAEADSRRALLSRLGLGEQPPAPARHLRPARRSWPRWPVWLAPAAAAAVVLFMWLVPPMPKQAPVVEELSAVRPGLVRGGGDAAAPDSAWRSGDAFELRARLSHAGWPAIVLVDPAGDVSLLRPAEGESLRVGAGLQRLAPADPAHEWVLEGAAGPEDLFVAVRTDGPFDRAALERELAAAARAGSREHRLEQVRRALERHVGAVRRMTLDHR